MTIQTSTIRTVNDPNIGPYTPTSEDVARLLVEKGAVGGVPRNPEGATGTENTTPKAGGDWVTNFGNEKNQQQGVDLSQLPKKITNPNGDIALVTGEDAPVNPLLLTLVNPNKNDAPIGPNGGTEGIADAPKNSSDKEKAAAAGFTKEKPELKQFTPPNKDYQTAVDRAHAYQNQSTFEMIGNAIAHAWDQITSSKMEDPDQATPTNAFATVEKIIADALGAGKASMDATMNKATGGTFAQTTKTIGALSDNSPNTPDFERGPPNGFVRLTEVGMSGGGSAAEAKVIQTTAGSEQPQANGLKVVGALDGLLTALGKNAGNLIPEMQKGLPDQLDGKWLGNAMEKFGFDSAVFEKQPIELSTAELTLLVGQDAEGDLFIALADAEDVVVFGDVTESDAIPAAYKSFDWDQFGFA